MGKEYYYNIYEPIIKTKILHTHMTDNLSGKEV